MGVPAFFRWLSQKYPSIITDAVEEKKTDDEGKALPVDTSTKNPNGTEYDNLYLDMNGIIHPCTHPEGRPPPKDEDEMMQNVYDVVDRLFLMARPRKVLYLAVDGVAPRAKMNQQRARRFRAAQEAEEARQVAKQVREDAIASGHEVPPEKPSNGFDSNCITPGTEFMHKVARTLIKYAVERLASDPGFKNVKVIVSDASVPGEGEHKIMEFIRQQRAQPGYDPNTKHCICGLDADLIMLGLATHEPHFSVLREVVTFDRRPCRVCGREGHYAADCPITRGECASVEDMPPPPPTPYQFLHLYALREYLDIEYRSLKDILPFEYDLEKVVDDFVFMCFFVGNDFLPHSPTLEIREGAIELLMGLYKKILPSLEGYLTNNGEVYGDRAKVLVTELSYLETGILQQRRRKEQAEAQKRKEREERDRRERERRQGTHRNGGNGNDDSFRDSAVPLRRSGGGGGGEGDGSADANRNAAAALKRSRSNDSEFSSPPPNKRLETDKNVHSTPPNAHNKSNQKPGEDEEPDDPIKLGDPGYRDRYYDMKLHFEASNINDMRGICGAYIEGLSWVLRYYYQGVCSWKWYYPFHYAPFAADIAMFLGEIKPSFTLGEPFKPFEQLMGVLPPASAKLVPKCYRYVMGVQDANDEPLESPIIHLYPTDFKLDKNGKRFLWQAVILLPFMQETDLLNALSGLESRLTPAEKNRNTLGQDLLFTNTSNTLSSTLVMAQELNGEVTYLSFDKGDLTGTVRMYGPLQQAHFGDILDSFQNSVGAVFKNPPFPTGFVHESKLLEGLVPPPKVLEGADFAGGAGGLGSRDGGYHRGQNNAAMRMINHNLGFRADKGHGGGRGGRGGSDGRGYGLGTGPNFVRAGEPSGLPMMNPNAPPFVPQFNNNAPNQFNNAPNFMPPNFNNNNNYNNPPNDYNNNYNNAPNNYNNGPSNYNNNYDNYNNNNYDNNNYNNNRGGYNNNRGGGGYNNNRGGGGGYNNNRGGGGGYNNNNYDNRHQNNMGGYNDNRGGGGGGGGGRGGYNNNNNNRGGYNNNNRGGGGGGYNNNRGGGGGYNNNRNNNSYQSSPYPNSVPQNYQDGQR